MVAEFEQLLQRIADAEKRFARRPGAIKLLAVSKTRSVDEIRSCAALGQRAFGENYLQEAAVKMEALRDLDLEWHYIGHIQSNKIPDLAHYFDWVDTLASGPVAVKLDQRRGLELRPLQVCIQVNISGEESKSGCLPERVPELANLVAELPNLRLRGLMAIPAIEDNAEKQKLVFRRMGDIFQDLVESGLALDTLSMGMSADFEAAIAEGSTMVRIGTALFGPRID